jgi:hypothetical protein
MKELAESGNFPEINFGGYDRVREYYGLHLKIFSNGEVWGVLKYKEGFEQFSQKEFRNKVCEDVRAFVNDYKWKFPLQKPTSTMCFVIAESLVDFWWPLNDSYNSFAMQCLSEFEDLLEVTEVGQA